MSSSDQELVPGVYGLRIGGLDDVPLLAGVDPSSPKLNLSTEVGPAPRREEVFGADSAEIRLIDDAWVSMKRSGNAHFVLPQPVSNEELIHPWLVPAAATFNGWHGRQVLHGGAFSVDGRAVAVLGAKEDGKSTLLAWLAHARGVEILADDLLVIDGGSVLAGPRCIDLRPSTADAMDGLGARSLVRDASRVRLSLGPCTPRAQLEAIVILRWIDGPEFEVRKPTASQAMSLLLPHALSPGPTGRLLELLSVPMWVASRPRRWSSLDAVSDWLLGPAAPGPADARAA